MSQNTKAAAVERAAAVLSAAIELAVQSGVLVAVTSRTTKQDIEGGGCYLHDTVYDSAKPWIAARTFVAFED